LVASGYTNSAERDVKKLRRYKERLRPVELAQPQRSRQFGITHEPSPHVSAAKILRAEQSDSDIDSENIRIDPAGGGIERIAEAVAPPHAFSETFLHRLERWNADIRSEHQRSASRARHHGSVNRPPRGSDTPRNV